MAIAQPTRSQLLCSLITDALLRTRTPWNAYAAAVVEHYHAHVAVADRSWEFHVATTADNHERASRLNTQTIKRILYGERRMCVDIAESLVAGVPESERDRIVSRLLDRSGLLLARKPADLDRAAGQVRSACQLMRAAAAAVERVAPMLEDRVVTADDAPHFVPALEAINGLMGVCVSLSTQITGAMGQAPHAPWAAGGRATA